MHTPSTAITISSLSRAVQKPNRTLHSFESKVNIPGLNLKSALRKQEPRRRVRVQAQHKSYTDLCIDVRNVILSWINVPIKKKSQSEFKSTEDYISHIYSLFLGYYKDDQSRAVYFVIQPERFELEDLLRIPPHMFTSRHCLGVVMITDCFPVFDPNKFHESNIKEFRVCPNPYSYIQLPAVVEHDQPFDSIEQASETMVDSDSDSDSEYCYCYDPNELFDGVENRPCWTFIGQRTRKLNATNMDIVPFEGDYKVYSIIDVIRDVAAPNLVQLGWNLQPIHSNLMVGHVQLQDGMPSGSMYPNVRFIKLVNANHGGEYSVSIQNIVKIVNQFPLLQKLDIFSISCIQPAGGGSNQNLSHRDRKIVLSIEYLDGSPAAKYDSDSDTDDEYDEEWHDKFYDTCEALEEFCKHMVQSIKVGVINHVWKDALREYAPTAYSKLVV